MENLAQNLRFALRQLARNPGFTLTVLLTLALSIGANTAIFSLVNALLLKSLPYPRPERLGVIYARTTGSDSSGSLTALDGQMWEELRDTVPALTSALSAGISSGVNLQASAQSENQSGNQAQYLHGGRVSARYLDVLGIHPLLGRNFTAEEDLPHGPKSVILSYGLWHTTFKANPNILGQPILLKGESYTVIGVLPQGAVTPLNADVYTSLQPSRQGEGGGTNFDAIVRLRDGATWAEADAQLNRAFAVRAQRFTSKNPGATMSFNTVPLQKGQAGDLGPRVIALMAAAGFILLIACANLAGLALVRTLRRSGEIATRLALGATSWQIQKQLWIENLILALIGGAAGIAVGFLALRGLLHLLPEHFLPVVAVSIDYRVLAFTLVLSLLTSLLFGMLPALATRKVDLRSSIAAHATSSGGLRLRQTLIAGEIALTVVLLAAAGLLIRTLVHLESLPAAFNPNGVLTAKASLDDVRFHDAAAFTQLLNQSTAAMRRIPGVENAAVGLTLPYERALNDSVAFNDGPNAGHETGSDVVYVTPGYFATLQIPIFAGRDFAASDGPSTQPVVIVNQTFARKFFNGDAVGHIVNKNARIIAVVGDTTLASGLSDDPAPLQSEETMYVPASQLNPQLLALVHTWFQPSWIVRTAHPVANLSDQMQRALASVDSNLPFSGFYSMADLMASTLATQRIQVALLGAMAFLALLLSTIGIFALVANLVVQRTREIGIRIALGSSIRQAMVHVSRSGVAASLVGLLTGLGLSALVLRAMRSVLYGVTVYDTPTILAVIATLAAVTLLAVTLPTLRIAHIDPAKTLREE
jgi:macrolide transport system ATP-binding/permease protein